MDRPFARFATRAAYVARQLSRFAWFVGHSFTMDRLAARAWDELGESSRPRPRTRAPIPDRGRLYQDLAALFRSGPRPGLSCRNEVLHSICQVRLDPTLSDKSDLDFHT
jgi:hypothetical protein